MATQNVLYTRRQFEPASPMDLPSAFNASLSARSPNDTTGDGLPPELRAPLNQLPALPQPPCIAITSIVATEQLANIITQYPGPRQTISSQPLISTSDRSSIKDISDRLSRLNSSISDAVDALMGDKLKNCRIILRESEDEEQLPPLMRLAVEECSRTKNKDIELRNRFQNAILHDFIISFIHDIIEGNGNTTLGYDYMKFRADIEKVRNKETFAEAQIWTRITSSLIISPSNTTCNGLAKHLMGELDKQLWRIGGQKADAGIRPMVSRKTGSQHLSGIIKSVFDISMEIYQGISSQYLKFTIGNEGSCADPLEVEMGADFAEVTSIGEISGCRNRVILGNRGLGLAAEFEDGTKKIYLKPIVNYISS